MDLLLERTYIDNHENFRVDAHVALEQCGQLGVAVGHMRAFLCDGIDHVAQIAQTLIDGYGFLLALPINFRVVEALTTRQVNQDKVSRKV